MSRLAKTIRRPVLAEQSNRPNMAGWEMEYRIRVDQPFKLLNPLLRTHWRKRKKYRSDFATLIRQAFGPPPVTPLFYSRVHIIRGNPPPRPDHDGLQGGAKEILDCLCSPRLRNQIGLGFILDDNPLNLISFTTDSVTTPPREGFTEIEIWAPKK